MHMRSLVFAGAATLLASLPVVLAQESDEPFVAGTRQKLSASLDDMLRTALRGNPDVLVAEATLRHAQASLNQARLRTAQEVSALHHERQLVLKTREEHRARLEEMALMMKSGTASKDEFRKAALAVAQADAAVAQVEASLRYVLGLGGARRVALDSLTDRPFHKGPKVAAIRPAIPDVVAGQLRAWITPQWTDLELDEVCGKLQTACDNNLTFTLDPRLVPYKHQVTLSTPREVMVSEAMLAIVDLAGGGSLAFVFRDYGVLLTTREWAMGMNAPAIPPETPLKTR